MKVILYGSQATKPLKQLKKELENNLPVGLIDHRKSIPALAKRLKQSGQGQSVVILFISDAKELQSCFSILSLLRKVRLILVLPDRDPETLHSGYRLEPRFIGFSDNGIANLQAVLLHMCLYRRNNDREDLLQMQEALGRRDIESGAHEGARAG